MNKYDTVKVIGSGTFGYVWLVQSRLSRQSYVLKEINLSSLDYAERKQALNEAEVLSQLKHVNIIRHREAWIEESKHLKIVMEYAEGGDLYTAIMNRNGDYFSEHRILTWFIQICLALQYIHSKNILHRDLKSQNIFLSRTKSIKVGDFGIARLLKGPEDLAKTAIGTPYYLSLEIFQRKPYNYKSDMWALGCVLFEMTALVQAFKATDFFQLAHSVLNGWRQKLPNSCSRIIKEVVDALLKVDPEERPSTAEVLENPALQPFLSEYMASQSPRDNFLPFLTGKSLKNERLSVGEAPAFRISNGNFIKRRNAYSSIRVMKRTNTLTNGTEKQGSSSDNRQPASKKCEKSHPFAPSKEQKRKFERKTSTETYSFKSAAKSGFFVSCDTYTIPPSDAEINFRDSEFTRSDESMNGYYDSGFDTALRGLTNVKVRDDGSYYNKNTYSSDSNIFASADVNLSQDSSSTLVADDDDVFSFNEPKLDQTFELRSSHCPHCECHKCMLDTLWKNRIRSNVGAVDKGEYYRLKGRILQVYKDNLFEKVHRSLTRCWDGIEGPPSDKKFQEIMHSLNYDQIQSLPLMVQLIQLEHLKKSKK